MVTPSEDLTLDDILHIWGRRYIIMVESNANPLKNIAMVWGQTAIFMIFYNIRDSTIFSTRRCFLNTHI
jgi:membrane protein insertase Oxa1/YidC/SpoIIIJ